jgi:hypothetical protein
MGEIGIYSDLLVLRSSDRWFSISNIVVAVTRLWYFNAAFESSSAFCIENHLGVTSSQNVDCCAISLMAASTHGGV